MPQNYWTDPTGRQQTYATQGPMSLGTRGQRAVERERTWSGMDPTFDPSEFSVLPSGQLREQEGFPWGYAALAAGAPLAGAFLPAMWGGSGAAGGAGAAIPGAADAPSLGSLLGARPGGGGALNSLAGMFKDPEALTSLAGVIAALSGGRGGGGQTSEEARRLQQLTEQRMRRVDPLHQAITQLAWNRLPTNARQGIAPPTYSPLG